MSGINLLLFVMLSKVSSSGPLRLRQNLQEGRNEMPLSNTQSSNTPKLYSEELTTSLAF